jgi:hypothetical protein
MFKDQAFLERAMKFPFFLIHSPNDFESCHVFGASERLEDIPALLADLQVRNEIKLERIDPKIDSS